MEKNLICIVCPAGCRLTVTGADLLVSGHTCKRGVIYAHNELKNPMRMVCTTARIEGGIHPVIPVKTDKPIPERHKLSVVKEVNRVTLTSPVKMGEVVIYNIFGTGVNITAARDM
jgi:CxxC motif-containing protein